MEENKRDAAKYVSTEKLMEFYFVPIQVEKSLGDNRYLFRCDSQFISKLRDCVDEYMKKSDAAAHN